MSHTTEKYLNELSLSLQSCKTERRAIKELRLLSQLMKDIRMLDCMEMGPNSLLLGRDTRGLVLFLRLMANTSPPSLNIISDPLSLRSLNVKDLVLMGGILGARPTVLLKI